MRHPRESRAINSSIMKAAILRLHPEPEWRAFTEYQVKTKVYDALAVQPKSARMIGYEVKVSMSDLYYDVRNKEKRGPLARAANEFYYVCPVGLNASRVIPPDCGLMEYSDNGSLSVKIQSPFKGNDECERSHLDITLHRLLGVPYFAPEISDRERDFNSDSIRLTLRIEDAIHDRLKATAQAECISLNALIVRVLSGLQGAPKQEGAK